MKQDQFSLVSEKVSGIPEDNFTIKIELFRNSSKNVDTISTELDFLKSNTIWAQTYILSLLSDTLTPDAQQRKISCIGNKKYAAII